MNRQNTIRREGNRALDNETIEERTEENITDELTKAIRLDRPSIGIDVDYYQAAIDDPDVSDAKKLELIEIISALVINIIDIGFGVHPVQLAQNQELRHLDEKQTPSLQHEFKQENHPKRSDVI